MSAHNPVNEMVSESATVERKQKGSPVHWETVHSGQMNKKTLLGVGFIRSQQLAVNSSVFSAGG